MLNRIYEEALTGHFRNERQMVLLTGPRQAGKTTTARRVGAAFPRHRCFTWDRPADRAAILQGSDAIAVQMGLDRLVDDRPVCILDEIHKFGKWKNFLKGLFDTWQEAMHILVTGSARMDLYRKGGDSLMGRYFGYRLHPLSVGELAGPPPSPAAGARKKAGSRFPKGLVPAAPRPLEPGTFEALWQFGGFPEPFLRQEKRFWNRWRRTRTEQLFKEDLRDLTRIQETGQVEVLAELVRQRVGQLVSLSSLAVAVSASVDSVKRWLRTLETLYFLFPVRPWHRNVARSLRKEPKYFLWDWSLVDDPGARAENMVASALLKSVHYWTDLGHGDFDLFFLRDKEKREVDFLVARDGQPWFLVEVKLAGSAPLSPALGYFQRQTGAAHAFQVAIDLPAVKRDCFSVRTPVIVPARTFLSQLV